MRIELEDHNSVMHIPLLSSTEFHILESKPFEMLQPRICYLGVLNFRLVSTCPSTVEFSNVPFSSLVSTLVIVAFVL